jgi:hypothetical protein
MSLWRTVAARRTDEQSFVGVVNASQGWVQSAALLMVIVVGVRATILRIAPLGTAFAFVLLSQRVAPAVNALAQWPMVRQRLALSWRRIAPYVRSEHHVVPSRALPADIALEMRDGNGGSEIVRRLPAAAWASLVLCWDIPRFLFSMSRKRGWTAPRRLLTT